MPINEFDRLVDLLNPFLLASKLSFDKLEETDNNKDISFLSGETGESFDSIKALADAHHMSKITHTSAEIWFGLFKNKISCPTDFNFFMEHLYTTVVSGAINKAIENNFISSKFTMKVPETIKTLKLLYVNYLIAEGIVRPVAR